MFITFFKSFITMNAMILVWVTVQVTANVPGEPDSTSNYQSIVHGIAAKIGFPPTVLKVFIKGDIQAEEIERLLNLCTTEEKGSNDLDLTRNRRNSISDYIGKLYSFNNLFRPYRSIFRGFKHVRATRTPWIKKILKPVQDEPKTESFWGMALGAHTFSPISRPLAQTRVPYHRIRNQQRIDRLLGITRNYGNLLTPHNEKKSYHWIQNQPKFDELLVKAIRDKATTALPDKSQHTTTRKAFHKAPLDVAGLRTITFSPHLHAITTPRHLKFCEKQCADEPEQEKTRRPQPTGTGEQKNTSPENTGTPGECATTETCTCAVDECDEDYTCEEEETERNCKGKGPADSASGLAVTKTVARTKHTTHKPTTSRSTRLTRFTRSRYSRPTGAAWTLPPNAVLDQTTTEEQRRTLPAIKTTREDDAELLSTTEETKRTPSPRRSGSSRQAPPSFNTEVAAETGESRSLCKHGRPTKKMTCLPMPIPTRIRPPVCPNRKITSKCTTSRCTTATACSTTRNKCCHTTSCTTTRNKCCHATACSTTQNKCCHATACSTTRNKCCHSTTDKCESQRKPPSEDIPISIGIPLGDQNRKACEHDKGKSQKIVVRISSALGEVPVVIMRDNGVSGVSLSLVNDYLLDESNRLIKCLGQKPMRGRMALTNSSIKPVSHSKGLKSRPFLPHFIRQQLHGLQPKRYSFRMNYNPSNRLESRPRASLRTGNAINILNPALKHDTFSESGNPNKCLPYKSQIGSFGLYPAIQQPRGYGSFRMEAADSVNARRGPVGQWIPQMNLDGFPANYISPTKHPRFKMHPGMDLGPREFELPGLNIQPAFPRQVAHTSQLAGYGSQFLPLFYPNNNGEPPRFVIGHADLGAVQ